MESRAVSSSLSAPPASSPQSFHSARTINSSPIRPNTNSPPLVYRQVKRLPYELREHCMIYFEEGLYCQALSLLASLLTSGTTASTQLPAVVPTPQHLALIATLAVHPTLTTRAKTSDRIQAANLALEYLRLVLNHTGPLQGNLGDAFSFIGQGVSIRRGGKGRRTTTDEGELLVEKDFEGIKSDLANAGSLWERAENFWHVVGWSFNCSVLHKRRWERWSVWLAYMIDVLQSDWDARERMTGEDAKGNSLLIKYMETGRAVAGRERKVVRAVFADGRTKSVAEFGEIWKNETKELKKDVDVKKVEAKIDIEADNYGDYMEDENEADLEDSASESSTAPPPGAKHHQTDAIPNIADSLGGTESVILRARLLSLLSKVSASTPEAFTSLSTLYEVYSEHIRSLPMPAFFLFMSSPTLRYFVPAAASTLTQYILRSMIAASAPLPPSDTLSQDILEMSYLPFSANTNGIVDNTKVSICVETLLRLLDTHPDIGLSWCPELHEAAETGIKARFVKAKKKQTKRGSNGDGGCDGMWLAASAERIRSVIAIAKP